MDYLSLSVIGNLGKQPEMRYTQSGKPVCSFPVAVNGHQDQPPTWLRVTCWERLAEIVHGLNLSAGERVFIAADSVKASPYRQQNGEPAASIEVTARQVIALGHAGGATQETEETIGDIPV